MASCSTGFAIIADIVLYVTLGALAAAQIGEGAWLLMAAAGASRVVQAAHYEGARRQYCFVVYDTAWMASEVPLAGGKQRRHPLVAYYLWLTGLIVPHGTALVAAMRDPARADGLRGQMRTRGGEWLGLIGPLSANYRTLAVGTALLAGRPQWFFLFEILVLGAVLAASWVRVRRVFGAVLAHDACASNTRA